MIARAPSIEVNCPRSNAAHLVGSAYARPLAREGVLTAALSRAAAVALTQSAPGVRSFSEAAE
jgi:hypothetical protein